MTPREINQAAKVLLTEEQAAQRLQVQAKTIGDWGRCGKLNRVVLSARCIRYRSEDVEALIDGSIEQGLNNTNQQNN